MHKKSKTSKHKSSSEYQLEIVETEMFTISIFQLINLIRNDV